MQPDLTEVLPLLQRDVRTTVGHAHVQLVQDIARDVQELDVEYKAEKLVEDVQQHFHDTGVDPTWPSCPIHSQHPLWYRDGAWWCAKDGVAVTKLGELAGR